MLLMLSVPDSAGAQEYALDRGSMLVGGDASFTSTGSGDDDRGEESGSRGTQLSFGPHVQYFVLPGLAVGGGLRLGYSSLESVSQLSYGIGPAVSYYFGATTGGRIHPYLSGDVFWGSTTLEVDGAEVNRRSQRSYRGAGGLLFLLTESVGITSELFYEVSEMDVDPYEIPEYEVSQDVFGLALGFSAFVF